LLPVNSDSEAIFGHEVAAAGVDMKDAAIYKITSSVRDIKAYDGFDFLGTDGTKNAMGSNLNG
jgi:hypothetical protein